MERRNDIGAEEKQMKQMTGTTTLPKDYRELLTIDLQHDRRLALIVNGISAGLMIVFIVLGCLVQPIGVMFDMSSGFGPYLARFGVLLGGIVVYMVLHELVHGIFMRAFSGVRPHYGFTGMYAFAGSRAFFAKVPYVIIALAPIVVWGVVLQILCAVLPAAWFWPVYFIQVTNLSGAAGDLYVTWRFSQLPADILVNDTGVAMTVYSRRAD